MLDDTFAASDSTDDVLLDTVRSKLQHVKKRSMYEALRLGKPQPIVEEFVTDSTEDVCYLLPTRSPTKMFFSCSELPDNDNLKCEQQGEGMDWVCEADIGI